VLSGDSLKVPERVYDADFSNAYLRHTVVHLLFGKRSFNEPNQLRSRLELKYPAEAFFQHFWGNSRQFQVGASEQAAKWPSNIRRDEIDLWQMRAERDHSEWVNFSYIARHGSQASIDFFFVTPAGIAKFAKSHSSGDLEIVSQVRVLMTLHELVMLLELCGPIAQEIDRYLPTELRGPTATDQQA
jgi:hypothetical protein